MQVTPNDASDAVVLVRHWCSQRDITVEVACWQERLKEWRNCPMLAFDSVLVESVLYRCYEDRDTLTPTEVLSFLSGGSLRSVLEELLLSGTVHPVGAAVPPVAAPSWADAVISLRSGLRAAVPWDQFFASLKGGGGGSGSGGGETPQPVAVSTPVHVPKRPSSAPTRPTSALSCTSAFAFPRRRAR